MEARMFVFWSKVDLRNRVADGCLLVVQKDKPMTRGWRCFHWLALANSVFAILGLLEKLLK